MRIALVVSAITILIISSTGPFAYENSKLRDLNLYTIPHGYVSHYAKESDSSPAILRAEVFGTEQEQPRIQPTPGRNFNRRMWGIAVTPALYKPSKDYFTTLSSDINEEFRLLGFTVTDPLELEEMGFTFNLGAELRVIPNTGNPLAGMISFDWFNSGEHEDILEVWYGGEWVEERVTVEMSCQRIFASGMFYLSPETVASPYLGFGLGVLLTTLRLNVHAWSGEDPIGMYESVKVDCRGTGAQAIGGFEVLLTKTISTAIEAKWLWGTATGTESADEVDLTGFVIGARVTGYF